MVNCCVNPACTAEHKLVRSGDVYAIESLGAATEYVWMCSTCGSSFEVSLDSKGALVVMARTDKSQVPPPPGISLSLVERGVRGIPLRRTGSIRVSPAIRQTGDWGKDAHGANV